MSSHDEKPEVLSLLQLPEEHVRRLSFYDFLKELKEHPEHCNTAPANVLRALRSKGEVPIDQVEKTSPQRARYLRMLKAHGIVALNAFESIRGSQRFVHSWIKFLENAAGNGQQVFQGLVIVGPPGSGKSMCIDQALTALEGLLIYAIDGCPTQENPINLLKLIGEQERKQLAEKLGLGSLIEERMKMAQRPCNHCWQLAVEGQRHLGFGTPEAEVSKLASVPIIETRLSARGQGISNWTLADGPQSLKDAFVRGSRGIVNLPEAFAPGNPAHQLAQLILEATQDRRLAGATSSDEKNPQPGNYSPLDACLLLQTNPGAWEEFLEGHRKDRERFIRRVHIITFPHNTSVSEEVRAYEDHLQRRMEVPHMDPLALRVAATMAVLSRLSNPGNRDVSLLTKMRMYDGEQLVIAKGSSDLPALNSDPWGQQASVSEEKNLDVAELWHQADEKEGIQGLNMGFMLSVVSSACERALASKYRCIASLAMLAHLREQIQSELRAPGHSEEMKETLNMCLQELVKQASSRGSNPGLVEKEYRRLLRNQMLMVFAPDYEERNNKDFRRYREHARASAVGEDQVFDSRYKRKVAVDITLLEAVEDEVDRRWDNAERLKFRRRIDADYAEALKEERERISQSGGQLNDDDIVIDWHRLLPELSRAITSRISKEIALKVERCLTNEVDLNEEDRKLRAESLNRFNELGYKCEHCRKVALDYFKELKLWSEEESK